MVEGEIRRVSCPVDGHKCWLPGCVYKGFRRTTLCEDEIERIASTVVELRKEIDDETKAFYLERLQNWIVLAVDNYGVNSEEFRNRINERANQLENDSPTG